MVIRTKCEASTCDGTVPFQQAPEGGIRGRCPACGGVFELSAGRISRLDVPARG